MTAPPLYWSLPYLISSVPILMILKRTMQSSGSEASSSKMYYKSSLILLLIWEALALANLFLPSQQELLSNLINRIVFVVVSLVVFFFVLSSVRILRAPKPLELLFAICPLAAIMFLNLLDPFTTMFGPYGWRGDITNPILRYIWLAVIIGVLVWSLAKLYKLKEQTFDPLIRRRLTYFVMSYFIACVSGSLVYLFANIGPDLAVVAIGLSLIVASPAFA